MKTFKSIQIIQLICVGMLFAGISNAAMLIHLPITESSGSIITNSGTAGGVVTLGTSISFSAGESAKVLSPTGHSLSLDGSANSRGSFATISEFQSNYSRLTVAGWVKISNFTHNHNVIQVSSASSGLPTGWGMSVTSGKRPELAWRNANNVYAKSSGLATITSGSWTHIALVFDGPGSKLRIYIEGVLKDTFNLTALESANIIGDGSTDVSLNRLPGSDVNMSDGMLDDLRVYYNEALTDDEIAALVGEASPIIRLSVPESSGSTTTNAGTEGGVVTLGSGISFSASESSSIWEKTGHSLDCDGSANSRGSFATISKFQSSYNKLSVAGWLKISDFSHYHHVVQVSSASGGLPTGWVFGVTDSQRPSFSWRNADGVYAKNSGLATIGIGVWTHAAMVFDGPGNELRIYIDGANDATFSLTASESKSITGDGSTDVSLNRLPGTDANMFDGMLDDFRVYHDYLLSDEEIAALLVPPPVGTLIIIQ